ncbi:Oxidoreductase, short-chain dehydrogenase/reductase family [Caballeronia sordidicola]|uniref:Oxidoreductase, short-chain dehydrogenase/reductase family n=1 Tax=Caballeronia sordidicola TaxID=196367 RepID=A0A242N5M6_CABSO|nr:Oxidoreductase, short-chain dehydrogenase/reductase family [Caballeronia sordidicola]
MSVVELVPPYVQTELLVPEQASDPNAMPLADFIAETMTLFEKGDAEVVVDACKPLRFAAENGNLPEVMEMLNAQH